MKKNKNNEQFVFEGPDGTVNTATEFNTVNLDKDGNTINEAFPVSERTEKDHRKTSVGFTLLSFILHVLAFVPIIAVTAILAVKCHELTPYYSFWPFVGLIIVLVFALIYAVVTIVVMRKSSKSSIGTQTIKIAITFVCLTAVFALLLTYILPDVISNATQNTLFVEDLYYNGEEQAEKNAKLDRDFIMYNLLNGNLNDHNKNNGDYSYKTLSKRSKTEQGGVWKYDNAEINANYEIYKQYSVRRLQSDVIDVMKDRSPRKYELYQFVYGMYVLNDFDYAMLNNVDRRALALAIVDYEYSNARYDLLLKEGFNNKKIKQLFDKNYDQFNQDGYQTFDDPLLLYAQMGSRMTVPVVLRLILNEGWMYSQPVYDADGKCYFDENNSFLYELYDPATRDQFVADGGEFKYNGKLMNGDGAEIEVKYGYNEDGWMIYENGVVKRTINWLVLDMLGDKMDLTSIDIIGMLNGLLSNVIDLPGVVENIIDKIFSMGDLTGSIGDLLQEDLQEVLEYATGGANLNIGLYMNDDSVLAINIYPMNAEYGMLGYMQATWVQSNNLLMAVINVMGLRNWLCIFGAVGVVLVIAAGICRECGRKTRLRTEVSRDRIARAKTVEKNNGEPTTEIPTENNYGSDVADLFANEASAPVQDTIVPVQPAPDFEQNNVYANEANANNVPENAVVSPVNDEPLMAEEVPLKKKKKKKPVVEEGILVEAAQPVDESATVVTPEPYAPLWNNVGAENAQYDPQNINDPYAPVTAEPLMAEEVPLKKKKKKKPVVEEGILVETAPPVDDTATVVTPEPYAPVNSDTVVPAINETPADAEAVTAEVEKPKKKKKVQNTDLSQE